MNKASYKLACDFVTQCATSFFDKGSESFGKKKLEGGWFIFRVQVIPQVDVMGLIGTIPNAVFQTVGAAYNKDSLYFFALFEEMEIVFSTLRELDPGPIEAVGIGWMEGMEGEHMLCNFTMIGDDRQGFQGVHRLNGLELEWLSEPVFTIEKRGPVS